MVVGMDRDVAVLADRADRVRAGGSVGQLGPGCAIVRDDGLWGWLDHSNGWLH